MTSKGISDPTAEALARYGIGSSPERDATLLAAFEHLRQIMPAVETLRQPSAETLQWFGRARALVTAWDSIKGGSFSRDVDRLIETTPSAYGTASILGDPLPKILAMIHQARFDLEFKTGGSLALAIDRGQPYVYFEQVRKIIEGAQKDLYFVDPFMNAEFVARYLPFVRPGVAVRLLASHYMPQLVAAADVFAQEHGRSIEIRRATEKVHDRYLFVDGTECYHSGASFKDGAVLAPTLLSKVTDLFADSTRIYESEWSGGKVERAP